MRTRILAPIVTAAMAGGLLVSVAAPSMAASPQTQVSAAAPTQSATQVAPVTINGLPATGQQGPGTLTGTFTPTQFINQNGQLAVQGTFVGSFTNTATQAVTPITTTATALITGASTSGSCSVLSLTLGPLHLDLLGLVVDLNQVNLNITAQRGPGNLLGNLLCSVAGLLDNGTGLQGVVNILNHLLAGL
jgi:hypothetical protein